MDWPLALLFLLACLGAGATGAMFQPGKWYEDLRKPSWTPPDWSFPVVWTILYICIAVAAARAAPRDETGWAMGFFAVQIAFNTLWTPIFFGLHNMRGGLVVITILWIAVLGTMWQFLQIDLIAGLLFAPYLLWVSIAFALNLAVWLMNRGRPIAT